VNIKNSVAKEWIDRHKKLKIDTTNMDYKGKQEIEWQELLMPAAPMGTLGPVLRIRASLSHLNKCLPMSVEPLPKELLTPAFRRFSTEQGVMQKSKERHVYIRIIKPL